MASKRITTRKASFGYFVLIGAELCGAVKIDYRVGRYEWKVFKASAIGVPDCHRSQIDTADKALEECVSYIKERLAATATSEPKA